MVVVDAMRFPYIDTGNATLSGSPPTVTKANKAPNDIYSAQRLQPYRGGHLLPIDTTAGTVASTDSAGNASPATGVTTICPPSPGYAYGYSEQMSIPANGTTTGKYQPPTVPPATMPPTPVATTKTYSETIGKVNNPADTNWSQFPFFDRDFNSVAELLLVPGCPPGLFTKQFVEEPYPGNYTGMGRDAGDFTVGSISSPTAANAGRQDFKGTGAVDPVAMTFPYLSDNFYYTAASVAPPLGVAALDTGYTALTTEIGGWTGAGWHKMMEFFEVPSSANGAVGTADTGNNYDWYRADLRPGQLNLNLIIDEEVFAGLIDDPRLSQDLAIYANLATDIPYVVSQVDGNGYPVSDFSTGVIAGRYPMFPSTTDAVNVLGGVLQPTAGPTTPILATYQLHSGRGYVYRDPNAANYSGAGLYQQLFGLKAAFSDFLKLTHGGSGHLFGFGAGDVGMGDWTYILPGPYPYTGTTQPIAASRPYRSLSYPDINYTIMRPASLPPSPAISSGSYISPGTNQPLPPALGSLFFYNANAYPTTGGSPFVELLVGITGATTPDPTDATTNSPLAPMNASTPYQYIQDPGIKNPFLPVQYVNQTSPQDNPAGSRHLAPPYEAKIGPALTPPQPIAAPFPPPIPPTPARRLFQVPDVTATSGPSSNASLNGAFDGTSYVVNQPVVTPMVAAAAYAPTPAPPSLVPPNRTAFAADNYTPQPTNNVNNHLGAGGSTDLRQHPSYRTEWMQKLTNLTTVRTHQFATWITVGFFEVIKTGTPELGIPDVLGQEVGLASGDHVRYRSFFVIDRTKATGFNPYYPGNFRDCVTYRRRIE